MSSEFQVDLDALDHIVARLNGLAGFLRDHLDQLDDNLAGLPDSWESYAAQAYAAAQREWAIGAREFACGVAEMSFAGRAAHELYTTAIDANRRMLGGR
ncbi:WXG100 family type VII secretion target [Nocardia iowensis]|uniref:WXG100 family type VII secretion target n=1 Tax=Nocardia iowensis TaxID=204891 RepID=A0ABX8RGF1_NOCIO|nr:WXG100 family type VII secretion target [Nocardia iowensis]QXN88672.1 WXG100 family type VII secretion target [Nocardia iowensis]